MSLPWFVIETNGSRLSFFKITIQGLTVIMTSISVITTICSLNQSKEYIVNHNKALAIQHILTHDKQYLDFDKDK
jgi:hypothetical protein